MKTNILEYLEAAALRAPERVAFIDEFESWTFARLLDTTKRIGSAVAQSTRPRQSVVVLIDSRSTMCVAAMLGALYAGCCYVPLDSALPDERLKLIADKLNPALALYDDKGAKAAESFDCASLAYTAASMHSISDERLAEIRNQARPSDPMAIMYTSGSTGVPKGVVQSHGSHIRYTEATNIKYGFTQDTIFGNQSPFFYANSIIDIFPTLALGAKTVILPAKALSFPKIMVEQLNQYKIDELTMTPSSYVKIAGADALSPGCLPHLRYIILSGEAAHWATLKKWMSAAPNGNVWNFYGSTEVYSVAVLKLDRLFSDTEIIPVGNIYDGVSIRFTGEEGEMVSAGERGEMLIHTPWLSDGYYNDIERTDAAFTIEPDGLRYYRTGDLGYLNERGELVVLGRQDTQIKHMGYRMEIGEVDYALRAVDGIDAGCCLFDKESGVLHCFWTGAPSPKTLTAALRKKLPRYALPDSYHHLDEMPYTANMKIDRQALKRMF